MSNAIRAAERQLQWSPFVPQLESYSKLRVMFQPLTLLRNNAQTYKCSVIMNEFRHEFSASSSPTALSPTDSGRLRIRRLLRFSPHPSTQDPRPFFSPSLFPSCSETVRLAISTTTSTKFSRSEMVRAAFPTQQGTSTLSITSTSAKLRTWKLEPFEYNGGQCIGTAFQGEVSNADRQAVILIQNMLSKSSLKRDADVLEIEDERPSKKKRVTFTMAKARCQTLTGEHLY